MMTDSDCIFCKIVAGELPSERLFQDDHVTAFRDINPAGPVHVLIVPNKHISGVNQIEDADAVLIGQLLTVARDLAVEEGVADSGYRLIINQGKDAGQIVNHLHLHLIGGQRMRYPMG
jgi:histidine triad (HIT) family protein